MRVLGIDPGSRVTGYGVIDLNGSRLQHVTHGTIAAADAGAMPLRLKTIYDALTGIIATTSPDVVAVEEIFLSNNARSALRLGHARGVALLVGVQAGLPVFEYTALQVKSAVVGYGKADKAQVQHMVKLLLNLGKTAPTDAADALAVAICHSHSSGPQARALRHSR